MNLPGYNDYDRDLVPVGNDVFEVDPSELFDSTGSLFNSRLKNQAGRALKFSSLEGQEGLYLNKHQTLWLVHRFILANALPTRTDIDLS